MNRILLLLTSSLASSIPAQVAAGDIAVTGFSTSAFGVISAGPTVTGYTTGGFQGTGTATSQAILWDRAHPNDFLVGGFGFIGRASITGPGSVVYAPVTNGVGVVSQMTQDDAGQIVFADSGTNQVRRLDPVSGVVTELSTGAQPWGSSLSSGAWDPLTGDTVLGGSGEIYRLADGATTGTLVVGGLGGFVSAIAFDPVTGEILATVLTANRLVRVSAGGAVSDVAPPFSIPGPNALAIDGNGDLVTGGGTGQVYRVPRAGGAPVFLASNTSPANAVNGLSVAGAGGYGIPFGASCSATSGPATLIATGPFAVGSTVSTTSGNHAANSLGILVLGLDRTNYLGLPLPFLLDPVFGTASCYLNVSLDVTFGGVTGASSPAELTFSFVLPPSFAGQHFYAQHACLEPVPGLLSWSNGLAFFVP
ncbi:MAG TPA: hypothetical protein VFZ65_07440 [Planctomycetota bacterium]|nr:hypothetical protein [Planctomycetota bacterium]